MDNHRSLMYGNGFIRKSSRCARTGTKNGQNTREPTLAVLYGEITALSAALGEYWQTVVRTNVGAVRQPLVDAPGVEDMAAWVVKRIEIGQRHRNRDREQAAKPRRSSASLAAKRRKRSA